jgi:hypothetical protein
VCGVGISAEHKKGGSKMETYKTITLDEHPNFRARIVVDTDPPEPYNDGQSPILQVDGDRAAGHVMTGSYTDKRRDSLIEDAWDWFQEHAIERGWIRAQDHFERYLRLCHDVTTVKTWQGYDYHSPTYITYDPADWRKAIGFDDPNSLPENFADSINLNEWRAYCEGDTYGIVIEKLTQWVKLDGDNPIFQNEDGSDGVREEWEEVDSIWGFYGDIDGYVADTACEMIEAEAKAQNIKEV